MDDFLLDKAINDFDIFEFLENNSDLDYSTESKNVGDGWVGVTPCPYCSDSRFHAALNIDHKSFNCWVCGHTTSLVGFISSVKNISYKAAIQFIIDGSDYDEEDIENLIFSILNDKPNNYTKVVEYKELKLPNSNPISSYLIKVNPAINKFFKERNITPTHVREYNLKIGIDSFYRGKLLIPIMFNKKLHAFQSRSITHKLYKNHGNIKQLLYEYDKISRNKNIVLVEGFFDFVRAKDFFLKFLGNDYEVTTGFSKILTDVQIDLLQKKNPKKIIYMLDRDAWYEYNNTCHKFICPTDFIILPPNKDPGSLSEKEFIQICMENKL